MSKEQEVKFREPKLIKAGANNLGLGINLLPPLVDCRVIAEDNYQIVLSTINALKKENEELRATVGEMGGLLKKWLSVVKEDNQLAIDYKQPDIESQTGILINQITECLTKAGITV